MEKFFNTEENFEGINQTFKEEVDAKNIFTRIKEQVQAFVAPFLGKQENSISPLNDSNDAYTSAINNTFRDFGTNTLNNMTDSLALRGLSVKDALDLIPRFNGANIPLSQFLDGCAEAKHIVPDKLEKDFVNLIRIRLYGEALNIARTQEFVNLKTLSEFFEKMFGSAKTYYDLMWELAKMRQQSSESVVLYLNRLKDTNEDSSFR